MAVKEIFSKGITSPDSVLNEYGQNQGIAAVIFWQSPRIRNDIRFLLVKEKNGDQYRKAGQWNIVTETRQPEERIKKNVIRGISEETGIGTCNFGNTFRVIRDSYRESNGAYNRVMGYPFKMRCLLLEYGGDPDREFVPVDSEIAECRMVPITELRERPDRYPLEEGAKMLIDFYVPFIIDVEE